MPVSSTTPLRRNSSSDQGGCNWLFVSGGAFVWPPVSHSTCRNRTRRCPSGHVVRNTPSARAGNRATAGLPGTGLFYTVHDRKRAGRGGVAPAPSVPQRDRLKLGFFQRLMTPAEEKRFIDGIRALNDGNQDAALTALEEAGDLPDAAWMAGMIRLRREELDRARAHFEHALARLGNLGTLFAKYEIAAQASLPITSDIFAHVFPRERGTRLALVEIAQLEGRHADAMGHIARLMEIDATDPVVLLSFAELALDTTDDRALMDRVVRATVHVENETPVDTAILLYRGPRTCGAGNPRCCDRRVHTCQPSPEGPA